MAHQQRAPPPPPPARHRDAGQTQQPPPPPQQSEASMALAPDIAELWGEITSWLGVTLRMLLRTGELLHDNERTVGATRNTAMSSAALETKGDAWFSAFGGGLAQPLLRTILSSHGVQGLPCIEETDLRKAADAIIGFMIANIGFGPLAAYLLNLEALFNFTPGLVRNAEIEAGMFEVILGALERRSEQGLIMSVVSWALLTIFIIEVLQQRDAACHGRLTGHSVETFIKDMLGPRLTRPGRQVKKCAFQAIFRGS